MSGGDFADSVISKYGYAIRSRRWLMYVFWHTITNALTQAWLLCRIHYAASAVAKREQLNQRKFPAAVATSQIIVNVPVRKSRRPSREIEKVHLSIRVRHDKSGHIRYDGVGHFPRKLTKRRRYAACKVGCTDALCEKMWHSFVFQQDT